jgi:hypothetical protein
MSNKVIEINQYAFDIIETENGLSKLRISGMINECSIYCGFVHEFTQNKMGWVNCVCDDGNTYGCSKPAVRNGNIIKILQLPSCIQGMTSKVQDRLMKDFLIIALGEKITISDINYL